MPLGRLCFAAYLINVNLGKTLISSQRTPSYMSKSDAIYSFLGILVATFSLSFVASLLFEMPFLNLDQLLLSKKSVATTVDKVGYYFLFKLAT